MNEERPITVTLVHIPEKPLPKTRPQPKSSVPYREPSEWDLRNKLFSREFSLQIMRWLERSQAEHGFSLDEVLLPNQLRMVELYFYPQTPSIEEIRMLFINQKKADSRWLNEDEVMLAVSGEPKTSTFRVSMIKALGRIYRRIHQGPEAIEVLKPSEPLLLHLLNQGVYTIPQIIELTDFEPKDKKLIAKQTALVALAKNDRRLVEKGELDPRDALDEKDIQPFLLGSFLGSEANIQELVYIMQRQGFSDFSLRAKFTDNQENGQRKLISPRLAMKLMFISDYLMHKGPDDLEPLFDLILDRKT